MRYGASEEAEFKRLKDEWPIGEILLIHTAVLAEEKREEKKRKEYKTTFQKPVLIIGDILWIALVRFIGDIL